MPSQPGYFRPPPLPEYLTRPKPQTSKTMRIWGWVLTIIGAVATGLYIWVYIAAQMNSVTIRSRFWAQIAIVIVMLIVGVVLLVLSKRKQPRHH